MPLLSEWGSFKTLFAASLALLPATAIGALLVLIEQALAASLVEGSNASLSYGYRLPAALQSLFVTAIGITALPYFASMLAQQKRDYCLHSFKRMFWVLGVGGGIVTLPLVFFSSEITALLYQRGSFDAVSVARVVPIQTAYFIQLPFALLTMLGIKTLSALGRNAQVSGIIVTAGILRCSFDYVLTQQFGVAGIAWASTAISALVSVTTFFTARAMLERYAS